MKHLLLLCLLISSFPAFGQSYWQELNAPPGGAPVKITQTTNGWVYAECYDHAVFCSQDNGLHWQQIFWSSSDPDTGFAKITVGRAGTLFAERRLGGAFPAFPYFFEIYQSTDNGESWQLLLDSTNIHGIGETSDGLLFAVKDTLQNGQHIVRSQNSGNDWQQVYSLQSNYYDQVEIDPYDIVWLSEGYDNLYFSTDAGDTWLTRYIGSVPNLIITASNTVIYTDINDLVRLPASGGSQTFQIDPELPGTYNYVSSLMRFPDSSLFAITSRYFYKSVDDGVTWERIMPNEGISFFLSPGPLQDGTLLANRFDGMARSNDLGATWSFSTFDLQRGTIDNLFVRNAQEWLALTDGGLFHTGNAGVSWDLRKEAQEVNNYFRGNYLAVVSGELYLLMDQSLLRSGDLGQTFQDITPPDSIAKIVKGVGVNEQTHTLFVSTQAGTARSTDNGITWESVNDSFNLRKMLTHSSGALFAIFDSVYWVPSAYHTKKYLFGSDDDGQTWSKVMESEVRDFTITPQGEIFAIVDLKIARSGDLGATWVFSNDIYYADYLASNSGGQLFAITNDAVRLSVDNGFTWQLLPKPPALMDATASAYSGWGFDAQNRFFLSAWEYGGIGHTGHLFRTANSTLSGTFLTGTVFKDADADCATNDPESPLAGWVVRADGDDTWYANTDSTGRYTMFLDTGAYFLSVKPSLDLLWESCADSLPVQLPDLLDTTEQDVPVRAIADCPYMTVQVAAPWLERCFENYVFVYYCNEGTDPADSVRVDVTLDPYLIFTDTLMNYEALGNNTFRFQLGGVGQGQCGNFQFSVYVDCDSTILGQTLCISAHIYPDSLCVVPPGWSGAEIQVTARCEQDTAVVFDVTNNGPAPTQGLHYFVIEDDVVLMQGDEVYQPDETRTFTMPANGSFRRFESEQEPGHPFSMQVTAWTEGCGGFNMPGFPNWYSLNNGIPSQDVYCGEIVGAFDPNDKQGFPLGYGAERLVPPNTDIEYLVRFQNTGTAPAHNVIVRDTLSAFLDPAALRMGTASHPFTWSLSGQGILTVAFSDINLPDSNANEAASHGFFAFKISQQPDLPDGTEILNTASIYFDFNAPIHTNETLHRVGRDFITVDIEKIPDPPALHIRVFPNPVTETALLQFQGLAERAYHFRLTDIAGRVVGNIAFGGKTLTFRREGLEDGVYFFQVIDNEGKQMGNGKLLLR